MLVLTRKLGESICIGAKIRLTIVAIDRGKIRLGIEAPREVPIFRQELLTQTRMPGKSDSAPEEDSVTEETPTSVTEQHVN
jgi:carbon storage regulator